MTKNRGQVAVEYVLLLVIAVTVAALIVSTMVSRADGEQGFVIRAWNGIIQAISVDDSGEIQ